MTADTRMPIRSLPAPQLAAATIGKFILQTNSVELHGTPGFQVAHDNRMEFFTAHRALIRKLDDFLVRRIGIKTPTWDGTYDIPQEFAVVVKPVAQGMLGSLFGGPKTPTFRPINLQARTTRPEHLSVPGLRLLGQRYNAGELTERQLASAFSAYHSQGHQNTGGIMEDHVYTPGTPIFWCWHAHLDDLFQVIANEIDPKLIPSYTLQGFAETR